MTESGLSKRKSSKKQTNLLTNKLNITSEISNQGTAEKANNTKIFRDINQIDEEDIEITKEEITYKKLMKSDNKFNNLILLNAESIGIKSLSNDVLDYLNVELSLSLKEILSHAKKIMRVTKRKTMKSDDINYSLSMCGFKKIIGYDSYAEVEFERIENYNGMWKQKQSVIDIDNYLSKPIANCPMNIFPHFHWISIEGIKPNIPENFIKEKQKPIGKEENNISSNSEYKLEKKQASATNLTGGDTIINNNYNMQFNFNYSNLPLNEKSNIVQPIIHNITKELQIFLENFELRFRKQIKQTKTNPNDIGLSPELEISLSALQTEPGLVELLPYILEFLMINFNNKQNLNEPKILIIIVKALKSIILNPYLNLSPYLHQIISLLMSIVLLGVEKVFTEDLVKIKMDSSFLIMIIYKKIEFLYPEFIKQLMLLVDKCLIINTDNPRLVSIFGAINVIFQFSLLICLEISMFLILFYLKLNS